MEFKYVEKGIKEKFLKTYTLNYKNKAYEMISRREINRFSDVVAMKPDSVVILAFNQTKDKILLEKEFRPAVGDFVYNFPAGLIDKGESPLSAAKRELWEETGLSMDSIIAHLPGAFPSAGICNELTELIVCIASGEIGDFTEDAEEIESNWYSKDEVAKLIKTEKFSARTQLICYLWSTTKAELF